MGAAARLAGQLVKAPLLLAAATIALLLLAALLASAGHRPGAASASVLTTWLPARQPLNLTVGSHLAVLAAGVAAAAGPGRQIAKHLDTFAHELGHATAAVLVGGTPTGLTLRRDGSGEAHWLKPGRWQRLRLLPVSFAGYWAAPAAAVAVLEAARRGLGVTTVLALCACGAAAATLLSRSLWSLTVTTGVGTAALALWHLCGVALLPDTATLPLLGTVGPASGTLWAGQLDGALLSVTVATVLIGGGVRSSFEQATLTSLEGSDAQRASRCLALPARLVAWVQVGGCLAAPTYVLG
jgi:hypothetical protein